MELILLLEVWITLFACMASRHVNLEMVQDKSCESFSMAFQRHCSENGRPKWVLSDNAAEYVRANEELWNLIDCDQTKKYFSHVSREKLNACSRLPQIATLGPRRVCPLKKIALSFLKEIWRDFFLMA